MEQAFDDSVKSKTLFFHVICTTWNYFGRARRICLFYTILTYRNPKTDYKAFDEKWATKQTCGKKYTKYNISSSPSNLQKKYL